MKVIYLSVGLPKTVTYGKKDVLTGGQKASVPQAILRATDFDGDGQADLDNHGGPDRAACVYSFEHYPYWEERLGTTLEPGAFSENLTISGIDETQICIGDRFAIGEALVEVSQPRMPCSKLAGKRGRKDLPDAIHANGFTGFYLRTLREGLITVGDEMEPLTKDPAGVTVAYAAQVMLKKHNTVQDVERLLAVPALSSGWFGYMSKRLAGFSS
jgi:MOSC domain-containing protein YiiM